MLTRWSAEVGRAARSLGRVRGFTAVTVLTLGLAIGANAAIFSVVDGVLLEALPFRDASELVAIKSSTPGTNTPPEFGVSPEFYVAYRDAGALAAVSIYSGSGGTVRIGGVAQRIQSAQVTHDFFATLGVAPLLGRLSTPDDVPAPPPEGASQDGAAGPGGDAGVVLISHAFWMQSLAGDPAVIGTSIELDDRPRTVIGVLPPEVTIPSPETVLWVPRHFDADNVTQNVGSFSWNMIGRLAEGTDAAALEGRLAPVAARLPDEVGGSAQYVRFMVEGRYRPIVRPLKEELVGDLEEPLWILLGTVGFVLLIACANVANLFLVRAESRQRDMAVRAAMGAGRRTLVRAHLAEALVLAALGGVAGALLASVGVPLLTANAPGSIPRIGEVDLDAGVLAFTGFLSIASALLFGLAAALRYSSPALLASLRSAGRGAIGGQHRHFGRNALVIAQTGLALVLLVGSGLLVRSFGELVRTDPGFDASGRLTFQTALQPESYPDAQRMAAFHIALLERLSALPGVHRVGAVAQLPIAENVSGTGFSFDDPTASPEDTPSLMYFTYASHGYFEAMGIELLAGRTFVRSDHEDDRGHAIISRSLAERVWPGEDPIGRRLRFTGTTEGWETVVGVVEDVRDQDLREAPRGLIYLPLVGRDLSQSWSVPSPAYVVHADDPTALVAAVRAEVRRADGSLPVYAVQTLDDVVAESVEQLSFTMLALGVSALMALLLGAVGLYGVLSYLVSQRTQEIGVRLALGAEAAQVRRMVVGHGAKLAAGGLLGGLVVAGGLTRVLQGLLYGTEPLDPTTFTAMSALLLTVGLLASWVPARRASTVDPVESMRAE